MRYAIGAGAIYLGGFLTAFFVLKNNPKLLNVKKLTQDQAKALIAKLNLRLP